MTIEQQKEQPCTRMIVGISLSQKTLNKMKRKEADLHLGLLSQ